MNDSSTGGVLLPTSPSPLNDADLDLFFQSYIAAITGIAPQYVRERFAGEPATPPDFGSTWAAVGVMSFDDDQFPQQEEQADGSYVLTRHETLDVLCSFYGPKAQQAARMARDNIMIDQNRDLLDAAGIAYMSVGHPIKAPALIQNRWTNKIDVTFTFRRALSRAYAVLTIESVVGAIDAGSGITTTFDTSRL